MYCLPLTPQRLAAKLRTHHAELATHYVVGSFQLLESEWLRANDELEECIERALDFEDEDLLTIALQEHMLAAYRLMKRAESLRNKERLSELERLFA